MKKRKAPKRLRCPRCGALYRTGLRGPGRGLPPVCGRDGALLEPVYAAALRRPEARP